MKTPHTFRKCNCGECYFCRSELSDCIVCGGFEGTLTTDCCGRPITQEEADRIYEKADLDFRDGKWVDLPNYTRVHSGQGESTVFHCVDGQLRTHEEFKKWCEELKVNGETATESDIVHALGAQDEP